MIDAPHDLDEDDELMDAHAEKDRNDRRRKHRRLSDRDEFGVIKLVLTAVIAATPIIATILYMWGDIRVIKAELTNEKLRLSHFETYVMDKDPLSGVEFRRLFSDIQMQINNMRHDVNSIPPCTRD